MKSYIYSISLIVLSFAFVAELQAQAPGLYGKRLIVEGATSILLNTTQVRYNHLDKASPDLNDNIVHQPFLYSFNFQLNAYYAISRLHMIGGGITHTRLGFGIDWENDQLYTSSINANVHTNMFNFYVRRYKIGGGSIAPLGRYYQYGASLVLNNRFFKESELDYDDPEIFGRQLFVTPALNFALGRQTIMFDKLLVDVGIQSVILLPFGLDYESLSNRNNYIINPGASTMYHRLIRHFAFRFKIGIGLPW